MRRWTARVSTRLERSGVRPGALATESQISGPYDTDADGEPSAVNPQTPFNP